MRRRIWNGAVGLTLLVAVWWVWVALSGVSPAVMPSPLMTAEQLWTALGEPQFWEDLQVSLTEFALGFGLGAVTGVLAGAWIAYSRLARRFVSPAVELFRFVIPFTWIPLVTLWFGLALSGKVFIVWNAVFFFVVLSTVHALDSVPALLTKNGRMLGLSGLRLFWKVEAPAALPRIAVGLQIGVATGWIAVIAAEFLGASAGLGYRIIQAQQALNTDIIISRMVVIGVVGGLMSLIARLLTRTVVRYEVREG